MKKYLNVTEDRYDGVYGLIVDEYGYILLDRTKTFDLGFPYEVLTPIPSTELYNPNHSMNDLVVRRAEEIYKEATKPILVMWSGGIDSTAVACGFIQAGIPFTLSVTGSAILENPNFYKELTIGYLKSDLIQIVDFDPYQRDPQTFLNQYHCVTGEIGDQLFGIAKMFEDFGKNGGSKFKWGLCEDWKQYRPNWFVEVFEPQVPDYVVKEYDLLWWINFSCKYQNVQCRMGPTHGFWALGEGLNYSHFFDTEYFQLWSIMNREAIGQCFEDNKPQDYKKQLKESIYNVFKDELYLKFKLKENSLGLVVDNGGRNMGFFDYYIETREN